MAKQTMTLACTKSAYLDESSPNTNKHGAASYNVIYDLDISDNYRLLLLRFDEFPAALSRKIIYSAHMEISAQVTNKDIDLDASGYLRDFDETTVTYKSFDWFSDDWPLTSFYPESTALERLSGSISANYLTYPTVVVRAYVWMSPNFRDSAVVYTRNATATRRPVIVVEYDDTDEATSKVSLSAPANGLSVDPTKEIRFSWTLQPDPYSSVDRFEQTSATFQWSSNGGNTWNDVSVTGADQYVTIAADTFPRDTITWRVTATDDRGATTTSGTWTITTVDQLITSSPVSPVSSIESGGNPITFRWNINSPSGTDPKATTLRYRLVSEQTWTDILISGPATSYTMPAGTLTAGTYTWGVNVQNQAGNWSSANPAKQFVCVAAPPAPVVTANAVPFAAINWQVEGQQAYRITVDGTVYGPYFGTTKTWTVPNYLPDGEHTITVEVQGVYGLWSQPGSASFTVQNQPGDAVTLSGEFERDGVLSWLTASQTADFLIYRDGVQIGHTSAPAFTDRFALGEHSYQVINRLPDGNYTASNIVTGTMISCVAAIAPLTGGSWIELTLSENSNREESFVWTQAVSMRHFAGAEYPVAEQSPFADLSGSYDVSFADLPSAKAFEALRGQAVILKSRGGNVMIGILSTLSKRMTEFYIAFTFSLQRMHWRDFIDADDQL